MTKLKQFEFDVLYSRNKGCGLCMFGFLDRYFLRFRFVLPRAASIVWVPLHKLTLPIPLPHWIFHQAPGGFFASYFKALVLLANSELPPASWRTRHSFPAPRKSHILPSPSQLFCLTSFSVLEPEGIPSLSCLRGGGKGEGVYHHPIFQEAYHLPTSQEASTFL